MPHLVGRAEDHRLLRRQPALRQFVARELHECQRISAASRKSKYPVLPPPSRLARRGVVLLIESDVFFGSSGCRG